MNKKDTDITEMKKLAENLANLKIKDAKLLADILKEEHGIEAVAPVAVAGVAASAPVEEEAKEEKTIFDVVLKSAGSSKLGVIKIVKNMLELGLKEAKETVESAPLTIKEGLSKEEAEKMKKQLTDVGAEVELK